MAKLNVIQTPTYSLELTQEELGYLLVLTGSIRGNSNKMKTFTDFLYDVIDDILPSKIYDQLTEEFIENIDVVTK